MKIYTVAILLYLFLLNHCVQAQDSIPTLKGKVTISILEGTIECNLTLSNIPRINNYVIRLNSGMNIRNIKEGTKHYLFFFDKDRNDSLSSGETLGYYFGSNAKSKVLPKSIDLNYVGKYPVIKDTSEDMSAEDWRGNVAFNGYSLRVDGYQSAWYPVLYDMDKQREYEKVLYDIVINCPDCNTLYVNGSKPQIARTANFKSDVPQQLTLFCGNYEFTEKEGINLLNTGLTEQQQGEFVKKVKSLENYYENHLVIPYKEKITFIQTTPTAKNYGFLFVSYPTILNVGAGKSHITKLFNTQTSGYSWQFIAHELAHYYFGSQLRTNSELGPVFDEGLSEFLSLKATKNVISDSIYQKVLNNKINMLNNFAALPFSLINSEINSQQREAYVYFYSPILFIAIEKEIGENKMWEWLKNILSAKVEFTNYEFLEKTLLTTLNNPILYERIKSKYFTSDKAIKNAIEEINAK